MTVSELLVEMYEGSHEQQDLNPYNAVGALDLAEPGCARLVQSLNRAIKIISTWKFPNGIRIRFKSNEGFKYLQTPETGLEYDLLDPLNPFHTQPLTANLRVVDIPLSTSQGPDYYAGWYYQQAEEDPILVIGSVGTSLTLMTPFLDTYGVGAVVPFRLYPAILSIGDTGDIALPQFIELRSVELASTGTTLERPQGNDYFSLANISVGTPTQYLYEGNYLKFDQAFSETTTLRVRYWKYPRPVAALTDSVDLPEAFHEPVMYVAKSELLKRIGEMQASYACWKTAETLMITLRSQADFATDAIDNRAFGQ